MGNYGTLPPLTSLTVRLSVLQVEGVVADWLLAGGTQEAVDVPGLLQGVDNFLSADENVRLAMSTARCCFVNIHLFADTVCYRCFYY